MYIKGFTYQHKLKIVLSNLSLAFAILFVLAIMLFVASRFFSLFLFLKCNARFYNSSEASLAL